MTAQIPEMIIISGRKGELIDPPDLPDNDSVIIERPETPDSPKDIMYFTTACWRQYVGEWKIRYGKLYLSKLSGRWALRNNEAVLADWYSGVLRIGFRKRGYEWEGMHSYCFKKQIFLHIEEGVVIGRKDFDDIIDAFSDADDSDLFWIESGELYELFK